VRGSRAGSAARHGAAFGSTIFFLIPVYVLLNLAFRSASDLTSAFLPTRQPTMDNFVSAWTESGLPGAIVTSIIVTGLSSVAVLLIATMAAYPLARSTAKLSNWVFYAFLIGLLLPFQLALLPLYTQMKDLGLLGTVWSLIIVYSGSTLPFSIFLITTFVRSTVPVEYEESARIDGCSELKIWWHIVVPLLRPVLGTVLILNGVGIWNDFFTPLIYLAGSRRITIPMAIFQFVGQYTSNWPAIFAALIISMIPMLALYLLFQRYIIQGFAGGLKG
jgi:raffinose/stachyose/melibiose transport system permease protein